MARAGAVMRVIVVVVLGAAAASGTLGAQLPAAPTYVEYRADAIVTRGAAAEAGGGVVFPANIYVRLSADGAVGPTLRDGAAHAGGRVDLLGRFLLDPFRESPIGVSLGGGVSVPYVSGDSRVRPYLTVVADIEGRQHGAFTPALQIGLGGGARIGLVLRRSPVRYR